MPTLRHLPSLLMLVALAPSVEAARPMVTDDARITDPQACQLETWAYLHEHNTREFWALPACNPSGNFEMTLGGAFFGESMFHRATDASKVALMHLAARLRAGGFRLLDTQFITPHLATLGAVEVPREAYHVMLDDAIGRSADFFIWPKGTSMPGQTILDILEA